MRTRRASSRPSNAITAAITSSPPPPPSSGGVVLCEMLNILEGYPLRDYGFGSARAVHFEIEAMRHAYVDRNHLLGDPAFVRNPLEQLLDKGYAQKIRVADRSAARRQFGGSSSRALPAREGTHTTHYSIADRFGNAVAVTYTLNDWFGARVTAAGTGVLLNNEMDDFTAKAGVPNLYGLVQGEANKIEPGKRPLSSMTPTIVTRDGKPWMILGTPGGSRIITAVLLTMLNVIDYDMDIQEAVDAPRIHQQWLPEETFVETRALSPDTRALLVRWDTSCRAAAGESRGRDPHRWRGPFLRRDRPAAEHGARAGLLKRAYSLRCLRRNASDLRSMSARAVPSTQAVLELRIDDELTRLAGAANFAVHARATDRCPRSGLWRRGT